MTVPVYKNNLFLPSNVVYSSLLLTILLFYWRQNPVLILPHVMAEAKAESREEHVIILAATVLKLQ